MVLKQNKTALVSLKPSSGVQGPTTATKKTWEELLKDTLNSVKNAETAKQYLESKCLVISGEPYTISSLTILLEENLVFEKLKRGEEWMEMIMATMEKKCITLVDDVVAAMERMIENTKKGMMEIRDLSNQKPPLSGAQPTQPSYSDVFVSNTNEPRSTPPAVQQTSQSNLENVDLYPIL
ncbi:hypothetical protein M422DRAFT_251133 [Sphaerobolus stellatus SS14]|uniref:Uncharacterized protein n=1 Tax=Sphaerobolus stellatus (strain SS14) TaxID=990650 RepID=A0A0C9W1G1_SPHS4|nr:hypothetical protein M422DRAFT_251133 [Sphaerobolus stellatus SS14]